MTTLTYAKTATAAILSASDISSRSVGKRRKWEWIRFNPDGKSVDIEDKLEVLRATIQTTIERIEAGLWLCRPSASDVWLCRPSASDVNTDLVRIVKLYY